MLSTVCTGQVSVSFLKLKAACQEDCQNDALLFDIGFDTIIANLWTLH